MFLLVEISMEYVIVYEPHSVELYQKIGSWVTLGYNKFKLNLVKLNMKSSGISVTSSVPMLHIFTF